MAGLTSEIRSILNDFTQGLSEIFDKLVDLGLRVDGGTTAEDGSPILQIRTASKKIMKVKMVKSSGGSKVFDMYFKRDNKTPIFRKKVALDDVDDTITDAIRELFGEDDAKEWRRTSDSVEFSTKVPSGSINVSIKKKVKANGKQEVKLTGIQCAQQVDLVKVYSALDTVLTSPDFVNQMPEGSDQWYTVSEVDDQIDVQPCAAVECTDRGAALLLMRTLGYHALFDLQFASWNAQGGDGDKVRTFLESFTWRLQDQLRCLAQLEVECCGTAEYPGALVQGFERPGPVGTTWDISAAEALVIDRINQYICALDLYTCLFDKDMQYQMLSWLREWKYVINYQLHGVNAQQILPCVN